MPSPPRPAAAAISKLLVIVEENHSAGDALAGMPFLSGLAAAHGRAADYRAVAHPSLPNYLGIAGGSTFGVGDDAPPAAHPLAGQSVFGQVLAAGRTAKTYAEAMPGKCALDGQGDYAVKHNPWAYFTAERAACQRYDVSMGSPSSGALHDDVAAGKMPVFGLLIPDLCHDAHDCSLAVADDWLRSWLPQIQAGPDYRSGRLAVIVTFDEDDTASGNRVLTVGLRGSGPALVTPIRLDHFALSAAISRLVGAAPLRQAAGAPDLLMALGLRGRG